MSTLPHAEDLTHDLVSVIVPIYNTESYLDQALTSIECQTHRNLEIIAVNDGSTDQSLEIIQAHAASDDRYRIIDKKNGGYGSACNAGLDAALGTWIAIVEPDDWIEPTMYEDMLADATEILARSFKEQLPHQIQDRAYIDLSAYQDGSATSASSPASDPDRSIDIIKAPYWRIADPDTTKQRKLNCSYRGRIRPAKQPFVVSMAPHLLHHHPSIWSALYRKAFLDEFHIRFHEIPGAGWADNPFLIDTLVRARSIVYVDRPHYCYREDTEEQTRAFTRKNPLLPFDRWNDMQDILEDLHVDDAAILQGHIVTGFRYLSGVIEVVGLEDPAVRHAIDVMFSRMDDDLVLSNPLVSPGQKKLYAQLKGLPEPRPSYGAYLVGLAGQGLYTIKNNGSSEALTSTTSYLRRRRARHGADYTPDSSTSDSI